MSDHRRPCTAEAPELVQPNGPIAGALGNHRHECIHDAETNGDLLEHECACGATWTLMGARPAPDTSWMTMETIRGPWPVWPIAVAFTTVIMAILGIGLWVGLVR